MDQLWDLVREWRAKAAIWNTMAQRADGSYANGQGASFSVAAKNLQDTLEAMGYEPPEDLG